MEATGCSIQTRTRKGSATGRLTLSTAQMERQILQPTRPKTAHEERLDARLDRDKFVEERFKRRGTMSSTSRTRDPLPFIVDNGIPPPWYGTGQAFPVKHDPVIFATPQDQTLHSTLSWASASDTESSRSLHSFSVPVSPKSVSPSLPHASTPDNDSQKSRKKTGWNVLGGMLHRKDTGPSVPKMLHKPRGDALLCGVDLPKDDLVQDDVRSLTPTLFASTDGLSNAIPNRIQHSRKNSAQVPRGLTRFEARAHADRLSFAQNPTFAKPLASQIAKDTKDLTKNRGVNTPRSSKGKDERADSFVSTSGQQDMVQSAERTPEIDPDVARHDSGRHDSVSDDVEDFHEPAVRESGHRKLEGLAIESTLASNVEESEPFRHLPRTPVLSPALLSSLDDPEEYIHAVEVRLRESREKLLGRSLPRLRPIQRAMTAPSFVETVTVPYASHSKDGHTDSSTCGAEASSNDMAERDPYCSLPTSITPPVVEQHSEARASSEIQQHPNPLFSHPPVSMQVKAEIPTSSHHDITSQNRPPTLRSSSLPITSELAYESFTPQDEDEDEDDNDLLSSASAQHFLPRTSSLQFRDHNVVQIRMARKISVREARSTFQQGPGTQRLRPKLLDLSKTQRPQGLHVRGPSSVTLLESFHEE